MKIFYNWTLIQLQKFWQEMMIYIFLFSQFLIQGVFTKGTMG